MHEGLASVCWCTYMQCLSSINSVFESTCRLGSSVKGKVTFANFFGTRCLRPVNTWSDNLPQKLSAPSAQKESAGCSRVGQTDESSWTHLHCCEVGCRSAGSTLASRLWCTPLSSYPQWPLSCLREPWVNEVHGWCGHSRSQILACCLSCMVMIWGKQYINGHLWLSCMWFLYLDSSLIMVSPPPPPLCRGNAQVYTLLSGSTIIKLPHGLSLHCKASACSAPGELKCPSAPSFFHPCNQI